jgi:hypothetical protein
VRDRAKLDEAIKGHDIVYANLTGDNLDAQADSLIASMQANGREAIDLRAGARHL